MDRLRSPLIHLIVWITYVSIAIIVYCYGNADWFGNSLETIISHLISAGIFYTTALYLFPKFFEGKQYITFSLLMIVILIASVVLRFFFAFVFYPYVLQRDIIFSNGSTDKLILRFAFQWFTFSLYALGYWQALLKIKLQKELLHREAERAKSEKLEQENATLRAQINPHFIFNTLEHFRSQIKESNPDASYGIGCFMQILRAGIVTPGTDGKIPLKIETEAIESTIYIFKQRFPDIELTHLSEIGDAENIRILPHILQPFVENAFKHGEYKDDKNKIRIELFVDRTRLKLHVFNKKGNRIKDKSTGIGLRYVKRHLESGYKNRYDLIIDDTDETYSVDLTVHLN